METVLQSVRICFFVSPVGLATAVAAASLLSLEVFYML
jgi:hypothetical protein